MCMLIISAAFEQRTFNISNINIMQRKINEDDIGKKSINKLIKFLDVKSVKGIIKKATDIDSFTYDKSQKNWQNCISAQLSPSTPFDPERFKRNFLTHSSCGVCGKTSIQSLELNHLPDLQPEKITISAEKL